LPDSERYDELDRPLRIGLGVNLRADGATENGKGRYRQEQANHHARHRLVGLRDRIASHGHSQVILCYDVLIVSKL
jgi:hypothetical protein